MKSIQFKIYLLSFGFISLLSAALAQLSTNGVVTNSTAMIESAPAPEITPGKRFFVIPVTKEIGKPQLFVVRRGVQRALELEVDGIILRMDTPGGRVDIMEDIVSSLVDVDIPTYTFIEKHAFSAGAIIAMGTDHIFMKAGSVIGAATPVVMSQSGYAEMGEAEREKMDSAMDAIGRTVAQVKDRDEMLIRCMIRRNLEYKIDEMVVSPMGELLTLTYKEAAQLRPDNQQPLLSEGTVDSIEDMLAVSGFPNADIIEEGATWADDLASGITLISPILMIVALMAFYAETSSPGIGWFGGVAVICMAIVFFGHNVAGLAGMEDLVIIGVGILLLVIELVAIPGFGLAGIAGISCIIWGLISSMVVRYPGNPGDLPNLSNFSNLGTAVSNVSIAVIGSAVLAVLMFRMLERSPLVRRGLILSEATSREAGYSSQESGLSSLLGQHGVAVTGLRPSGDAQFGKQIVAVLSDGDFINRGEALTVLEVEGNRVVVTREETNA